MRAYHLQVAHSSSPLSISIYVLTALHLQTIKIEKKKYIVWLNDYLDLLAEMERAFRRAIGCVYICTWNARFWMGL